MEHGWLVALVTILFLALITVGVPIAFAAAASGIVGIILLQGMNSALYALGTFPVSRIATFTWTALPLFILMGNLAQASGIGADAYNLARKWVGNIKGSLVLVTIASCGLIAATTGSGATGTVIMGKIAVPEMRKYGYDLRLAVGAVASAGPLGILIPPSAAFVIIGILTYLSIGKLFLAGILPGILTIIVFSIMVYIRCQLNPKLAPTIKLEVSWGEKLSSLVKQGWGIAVLFLSVMIPLFIGLATPTEIAALGCFMALILWCVALVGKRTSWGVLWHAIIETVQISVMVLTFVIGAGLFSLFLAVADVVPALVNFFNNLSISPFMVLILIVLLYVPLGMFLDNISLILLTVPVVYPLLIDGFGFDGIWFSVILVVLVELAAITPPVGLSLFVAKGVIPDVTMEDIITGCLWFVVADFALLAILIAFPIISTYLPSLMSS